MTCRSGSDPTPCPHSGPWAPDPFHPSFYYTNMTSRPYYACALPRALTCALRNGAEPPIRSTFGGVFCRDGNLFYRPPCPTCNTLWARNPGLLRPSYLRPAPPALGWPPGQVYRPLGPGDWGGFGGGRDRRFAQCGGGRVQPPFVDPPFEGAAGEGEGAGCGCTSAAGGGDAGLALIGAALALGAGRRRRR